MRFDRREALLGGACLCCLSTIGRALELTIEQVAPGVYVRRGVDEDATPSNRDAIANIGFIVGDDAVLVTETGGSLSDGRWLRDAIKATTNKPIKYVVLSHVHPDHVFGASVFADDKPVFIGHAKLRGALEQRGDFYRDKFKEIIGVDQVGPVVMPTKEVVDTFEVDLGGRPVRFHAHGPAHHDLRSFDADMKSGLLLPADLLFVGRVPALDGSLLGWLKELDVLRAMGAEKAVPGHGPVTVDFAGASADLARYLVALRDGVRAAIKGDGSKGDGSIDAAVKTVGQSEKARWLLFDDYNARNVTQAYKELEWE